MHFTYARTIISNVFTSFSESPITTKLIDIVLWKAQPVNKEHLTNNEKLTRPFEQLGINLTLHDIAIIEHRNDLLHGNILLKTDESQDEEKTNLYMTYVSAKLFTLISKLILKATGYKGYVYNQAKYLEKYMVIETSEEFFEEI